MKFDGNWDIKRREEYLAAVYVRYKTQRVLNWLYICMHCIYIVRVKVWGWKNTKKICEMDLRFRYDNTELHVDRRMQANRNQRKAARYKGEAIESKKEPVKECIKERERNWGNDQEGKRARKRRKRLEEVRNWGTRMEAREEQERMTVDQIIEERRKREAEEREKYNKHYRKIAKEELPKYLKRRMKWKNRKILSRFRCGNETKAR